jgi:hypothetical protein
VSRVMRDAVAATGLRFEELGEMRAMDLGCLSAVQRLERGGRLSRREYLGYAAARGGLLEKLQVLRARTARRGTGRRARRRRGAGTSMRCSGRARMGARETSGRARGRRRAGTSRCCSGHGRTAARGTSTRALVRRRAGTSRCCSGRAQTAARGMKRRVRMRRWAGILRCCSGRARTARRGTGTRAISRASPFWRWRTACWSGRWRTACLSVETLCTLPMNYIKASY